MKTSERMLEWLRGKGVKLSDAAEIRRTYAGRHQMACGSWSWYVCDYPTNPCVQIGGYSPMQKLLKCPNLGLFSGPISATGDSYVECGCIGQCKGIEK